MDGLTGVEGEALLDKASQVHAYKLVQFKGYDKLAKKARDERAKRLLAEISQSEIRDANHWAERIQELTAGSAP